MQKLLLNLTSRIIRLSYAETATTSDVTSIKGVAADFAVCMVGQKQNMTWAEFRAALVNQFSDSGDEYVAQAKLAKLRQAPGESVQNFCERIFAIAAEAYKGQDLANTVIQQVFC